MGKHERQAVIEVRELTKSYLGATVFANLHLDIESGFTALVGTSGSGKTTLLNQLMAIDRPDSGQITIGGIDITQLSDRERTKWRAENGQIFQNSGLIGGLTVYENIVDVHSMAGNDVNQDEIEHLMNVLDIHSIKDRKSAKLSGGQRQRVALVRALAHCPKIVFADEPTASLDTASKVAVHDVLKTVSATTPVVMVSHDAMTRDYADRIVEMHDGMITSSGPGAI